MNREVQDTKPSSSESDEIYAEEISSEPRVRPRMEGQRILVIDDEAELLKLMSGAFEEEGAIVSTAADGMEGLRAFTADPVDLVVTDIIMPTREGIETIIALKRIAPSVKVVAISGGGRIDGADFLKLAEAFGADATMAKPFRLYELVDLARALLPSSPPAAA